MKKYLYLGIFWTLLGSGAVLFDVLHDPPYFSLLIGPLKFPIGILIIVFGVLHLLYYYLLYQETLFTQDEEQYAQQLEAAVPTIIDRIKEGKHVDEITQEVEEKFGIPPLITVKYILNLGRLMKKHHGNS